MSEREAMWTETGTERRDYKQRKRGAPTPSTGGILWVKSWLSCPCQEKLSLPSSAQVPELPANNCF